MGEAAGRPQHGTRAATRSRRPAGAAESRKCTDPHSAGAHATADGPAHRQSGAVGGPAGRSVSERGTAPAGQRSPASGAATAGGLSAAEQPSSPHRRSTPRCGTRTRLLGGR